MTISVYDADTIDAFHKLVEDLSLVLGPSSGLDSEEVDPQHLVDLMEQYTSNEADWERYAWRDSSRAYTRNLVDKGNGRSNLLVLVWTPGKGSPIHDHADAHCVMKVLQGRLQETLYEWPAENARSCSAAEKPLTVKRHTVLEQDQTTYMCDEIGLHRISNPDLEHIAVSLHLYTPPRLGCDIFDAKTGRSSNVKTVTFSEFGHKVESRSFPPRTQAL